MVSSRMVLSDPCATHNLLLSCLSGPDFERLALRSRLTELAPGETIYEADVSIDHVYFPETGLLSLITDLSTGASVETSVVGRDSGFGFVEAIGSGHTYSRVVVQAPGEAWITPASVYRAAFDASPHLRRQVSCLLELQLAELRQNATCLAHHDARPRLARWLLECHDRAGRPETMSLTQDFLASMMGVGRPTVSQVAGQFQEAGLIAYSRGGLKVLDRSRLEFEACECRQMIQDLRRRILPASDRVFG